ncbi:MAG: hypothetical protein HY914_09240 [Desulfomonile tiedjei]|nr:hypothetical protein [Desulfomonile tiedjei]
MIVTGSALFIQAGMWETVLARLKEFPEVTYQARSDSGAELIVNFEADDHAALEALCDRVKHAIPEIIEIAHMYINFEEEIEKIAAGAIPMSALEEASTGNLSDASSLPVAQRPDETEAESS